MSESCHWTDIASILRRDRESGFLCDIILKSRTKEYVAHRNILGAVSSVLRAEFQSNPTLGLHYVNFPDLDDETAEVFLHFVYTGKLILPPGCASIEMLSSVLKDFKSLGVDMKKLNGCRIKFSGYGMEQSYALQPHFYTKFGYNSVETQLLLLTLPVYETLIIPRSYCNTNLIMYPEIPQQMYKCTSTFSGIS